MWANVLRDSRLSTTLSQQELYSLTALGISKHGRHNRLDQRATQNQIDHVLVSRQHRTSVLDTRGTKLGNRQLETRSMFSITLHK